MDFKPSLDMQMTMLRKELQVKKRHHYVWANYLTRWGNGTSNVFYTTKLGKIANDSVRAIAVDDYFYRITTLSKKHVEVIKGFSKKSPDHLQKQHVSYLSDFLHMQHLETLYRASGIQDQETEVLLHASKCNWMENLHSSHENSALKVLSALADEQLEVLQDKEHMIEFMSYLGQQIVRTKAYRDEVLRRLHRRNDLEVEVADAIAHSWWFLSYMFGMNIGFSFFSGRHDSRHALLVNNTDIPFITSDHPVVNVHPCVSETELSVPEYADFYYPISPRIAYIICDSERFTSGKHNVDEAIVNEFNSKVAAQAMVHIVGNSDSAIRPYKKHIGKRYKKNDNTPS